MTRDEYNQHLSEKAWKLGQAFGREHRLLDLNQESSEEMYQEAMRLGCPALFFDVFKYGAQDIWRSRGELEQQP